MKENLQVYGKTLIIYDPKNILVNHKQRQYTLSSQEAWNI